MNSFKKRIFFTVLAVFLAVFAVPVFSATMDARVRKVPQAITDRIFDFPAETLPDLVKNLVNGVSGTQARVKVLHDWICDNIAYDTDVFTEAGAGRQDYETVLKKRKATCSGYTNVMNTMCALCGIESVGIAGWSKGFAYQGYLTEEPTHAWNAVKIGGRWQLIDVTWDAGFVDYATFVKHYTSDWLGLTAEQFIYSHLPQEDEMQFLKVPCTKEEFVAQPYIPASFFASGLSLGKNRPLYTNVISEAVAFDFVTSRQDTVVRTALYSLDSSDDYTEYGDWIERTGNAIKTYFDIPRREKWRGEVLVSQKNGVVHSPIYLSKARFESLLLLAADLCAEQKISQAEYDFFAASYFFVEENGRYYLLEDVFDTARNAAVQKVFRLTDGGGDFERVLYFDIVPDETYTGYGNVAQRFPKIYQYYVEAKNTRPLAPLYGTVERGSEVTFSVFSREYTAIGFVIDGELVPFVRDQKSGTFSLTYEIPAESALTELTVYGSKDGRTFATLYGYAIRERE